MRARSKIVLVATCGVVAGGAVACASVLGDFTAATTSPGDASDIDATVALDAAGAREATAPEDGGLGDGGVGREAGDAANAGDAGDASTCGATCAVSVSANGTHTCAVMGEGSVLCWGRNVDGESGPSGTNGATPAKVPLPGPAHIVRTGATATCAIMVDGSVWCWGSNALATLGVPDASATADGGVAPVQTLAPGAASALLVGSYHACALTTATPAGIVCWGLNGYGQAGVADAGIVHAPTPVAITNVVSMSAGPLVTCFVRSSAPTLECMGTNAAGELGHGAADDGGIDTLAHPVPSAVDIGALGNVRAVYRSAGPHMGATLTTAQIALWGSNADGELGPQNDSGAPDPTPTIVPFSDVAQLAMTTAGTCALRSDGTVWCWGTTADGQNGNTTTLSPVQTQPLQVTGLANVTQVTAGFNHLCALLDDGSVECWGYNNFGQLGRVTAPNIFDPTPAPVAF